MKKRQLKPVRFSEKSKKIFFPMTLITKVVKIPRKYLYKPFYSTLSDREDGKGNLQLNNRNKEADHEVAE